MNPLVHAAVDVVNAYNAVKRRLGSHTTEACRDGSLKIHLPGRPSLTLTIEDARAWAAQADEERYA